MYKNEPIDRLAHLGESIVDILPIKESTKIKRKLDIGAMSFAVKAWLNSSNNRSWSLQEMARHFDLDRIVWFPCMIDGELKEFFRMQGGDIPAFCQCAGIQLIRESSVLLALDYISKMEKEYGVVIYEKQR